MANILVDWVWGSGHYGITIPQGILGVKQDGIVGEKTLNAVNDYPNPEALFEKIKQVRRAFYRMICQKRPANQRFLKGWLNRLNDFKWMPAALVLFFVCSCKTATRSTVWKQSVTEIGENRLTVTEQQDWKTVWEENRQWTVWDESVTDQVNIRDRIGLFRLDSFTEKY